VTAIFDWQFAWEILPVLARAARVTVLATLLGFLIAMLLGLVLALARRSAWRAIAWPTMALIEFIRSTPLIIQIYFLFFITPNYGLVLSPLTAGLISIGLYYACFLAEVYRAGLDAVPKGQWESVTALNMTRWHGYRGIILPQAIPPMVPAMGNYLVDMFKATPVLSVISVLEMMTRAKMIGSETFRYTEPITLVGVFFLLMTLVSSALVRWTEHALARRGGSPGGRMAQLAGV